MAAFDRFASFLQGDIKPAAHAGSSDDYREALSRPSMTRRISTLRRPCQRVKMPTSKPAAEQVQHQNPFAGMGLDGRTAAAPFMPNRARVVTSHGAADNKNRTVDHHHSQASSAGAHDSIISSNSGKVLQPHALPSQHHTSTASCLSSSISSSPAAAVASDGSNSNLPLASTTQLFPTNNMTDIHAISPDAQVPDVEAHRTIAQSCEVAAKGPHPSDSFVGPGPRPLYPVMPPAFSQIAPPADPADPAPCTPGGPAQASDSSCAMPGQPVKPASSATPVFGGGRKLFVRSKADKGRARQAPMAPGQAGLRTPLAPLKQGAYSPGAAATSSRSARLRGLLMGGRQLHTAFLQSSSEECTEVSSLLSPCLS